MTDIRPVTEAFAVAPQLSPADMTAAAALGYRTIINNRPDGEAAGQPAGTELRAAAAAAGLEYFEIPVRGGPTPDQVRAMAQVVASSAAPVLAFCRSGTRSITTWAMGQMASRGRDDLVALGARAGYDLDAILP